MKIEVKSCADCPCCGINATYPYCVARDKDLVQDDIHVTRPDWCPLPVEVVVAGKDGDG